jgi:hypothetical protein
MGQIVSTATSTPLDDDALISAPVARGDWWGGISEATEWRWAKNLPGFPKAVRINRRKFYRVGDLRKFSRTREAA